MPSRDELALQDKILSSLKEQGFYTQRTVDRFVAGKPDFRVGKVGFEQIDFELKVIHSVGGVSKTGISPIQFITLREMNKGGMRACGLVYCSANNTFYFTNDRELDLDSDAACVVTREQGKVIDGVKMMNMAMMYLEDRYGW